MEKNQTIRRLALADTMELLANSDDPVKLFYDSPLTSMYVEEIQRNGKTLTVIKKKSNRKVV